MMMALVDAIRQRKQTQPRILSYFNPGALMKTPITEDLEVACSTMHEQDEVLTGLEASLTKRLPGGFKESIIAQTQTLRNVEKHLNDLKKENFSLKLRIYFLEERIQQKYEDNREDIYRQNIELKVEVESLKQELQEKQQSLDKAWTEAENQSNKNEAEICHQPKNKHVCETLEKKIQTLQEEMQSAKTKAEKMAALAEVEKKHCLELNKQLMELSKKQDEIKESQAFLLAKKDKKIEELIKNLKEKEELLELQSTEEQNLLQYLEKPQEMKVQTYEELTCE